MSNLYIDTQWGINVARRYDKIWLCSSLNLLTSRKMFQTYHIFQIFGDVFLENTW